MERMPRSSTRHRGTAVPFPSMVTGSAPPWTLREQPFSEATRTYYVETPRAVAESVEGWLRRRYQLHLEAERLEWRGLMETITHVRTANYFEDLLPGLTEILRTLPCPTILDASTYVGTVIDQEPHVAIEIPGDARVLSWLGSGLFHAPMWGFLTPTWHEDMLAWFAQSSRNQAQAEEILRRLRDDPGEVRNNLRALSLPYAHARGYKVVLFGPESTMVLGPEGVRISAGYPRGVRGATHRSIVEKAIAEGHLAEIPDEVLATYGILVVPRWDLVDQAAKDLLAAHQALQRTRHLHLFEHSLRQDAELDYLGILAVRRMFEAVGLIGMYASRAEKRWRGLFTVVRRFPMPGQSVADRRPPKGMEDWPVHLLEIALQPQPPSAGTEHFSILAEQVANLLLAVQRRDSDASHKAITPLWTSTLRWSLTYLHWQRGEEIVETLLNHGA